MPHGLLNNLRVRISGNQKIPRKFQIPIELLPSAQPPKAENPASTSKNPLKYSYEPTPQYAIPHENQSPRATADAPCADGFGWPKIALGAWRWFWAASGGFQ